jgi:uncharacterized small protein (TIGR04563 family)
MSTHEKSKQSLYFPEEMLKEIQAEAARQDRSLSWIVQKAWRAARRELSKYPSSTDPSSTEPSDRPTNGAAPQNPLSRSG